MKQGDYAAARDLLETLYRVTPPPRRTRSMVLNRAIADMGQKTFVMRAVRELGQYLAEHKEDDEQATNVLAGALNIAAHEPRLKRGPIWQAAYVEWERRNEILDRSRPGSRRWGTQWITDEQYAELKEQKKLIEQAIEDQQKRVDEARDQITALHARGLEGAGTVEVENDPFAPAGIRPLNMTRAEVEQYEKLRQTDWAGAWRFLNDFQKRQSDAAHRQEERERWKAAARERRQDEADAAVRRQIHGQISEAQARLNVELYELGVLVHQRPRPDWPTQFQPLDP
jgi:hypothetical protein